MHRGKFWLIIFWSGIFTGCTVGPKYQPPAIDVPCEWHAPASEGMQTSSLDCFRWWESLNDPQLNSLMERAAFRNLDLYIAAERIMEARAQHKGGIANFYPHLDASASYEHLQFNQKTLNHILGGISAKQHRGSSSRSLDIFEAGFDAQWEIDLFGRHAHTAQALKARIESSTENFGHIWVTLSAEIARNYIELRGFQLNLQRINKNIDAQEDMLALTNSLAATGFSSVLDQMQAEQQLKVFISQKPDIQLSIDKAIHRLSILLGYAPGKLFEELSQPGCLPTVPYDKPIGVPSELLRRRPDIRRAERELAAATEMIGSAVAGLFPRLTLQGFIGEIAALCSGSFTWLAGPQLLLPIFNSRLIEEDVEINQIKTQQAFYEYQKTVLEALEETENALAAFYYELEKNTSQAQAHRINQDVLEQTLQLYQTGFKDYLEVLTVQRSFLASEEGYLQSRIELLLHYISLYKALGGGWDISCD